MTQYHIPKRPFLQGEKKPITLRMPSDLKIVLEGLAKEKNRSFTDLILTALDQFAEQETKQKRYK